LDADIKGFFDNLNHEMLLDFLKKRIGDKRVLRLISKWLKTGFIEDGKRVRQERGTPQGSGCQVPGKLFLMDGFGEGDPCPGQSKGNRQMANKLPDPISPISTNL
jgi:hypothetical protein